MSVPILRRGSAFRAEHDESFAGWHSSEPRNKLCLVFNAVVPAADGDVHYFLATSKVHRFRENPSILSEVIVFAAGIYQFFPAETAIDFRQLWVVPFSKLLGKNMQIVGDLSMEDIVACEQAIGSARLLENRSKKLLRLR